MAGVHGRLWRLPGCEDGGARRHAVCESLPPRPTGSLHAQEASHTLGSGWPKASLGHHQGEGPTAKSGRDSALARARSTVKCCQNPGQIKSEPAVK